MSTYHKAVIFATISIIMIVIGMIVFELYVSEVGTGIYLEEGKLSDAQKESINISLDLLKTLMTWVIAVIGATAFFLKLNVEQSLSIRRTDLIISFIIILLSIISLYLGHLAVDKIAKSLSLYQFPIDDDKIQKILRLQYVTGLAAVALFGFHIFQFFWARIKG